MVDINKIDITMSTVAVLITPSNQPAPLNAEELEKILAKPVSIGQGPEGLIISSARDQIEVVAGGIKINVRDLSGRNKFSQSKIPSILIFFVNTLSSKVTSYGVNFIMTVPCEKPEIWISKNILNSNIFNKTNNKLIGGAALLKIESAPKTITIRIDPGKNDNLIIDYNASENSDKLPENNKLLSELDDQFNVLVNLLNDLGI